MNTSDCRLLFPENAQSSKAKLKFTLIAYEFTFKLELTISAFKVDKLFNQCLNCFDILNM